MQRSGPVAPLTTDRPFNNLHLVEGSVEGLRASGVADEATLIDGPLKTHLRRRLVARRHVPRLARLVPGQRRLGEKAVDLHEIAAGVVPRADDVRHRVVVDGDLLAGRVCDQLAMPHPSAVARDLVAPPGW